MERTYLPTPGAAAPCDYIFAIAYHSAGFAAYIIKDAQCEVDAWRKLATDNDLRDVRSITLEIQPNARRR